VATPGEVFAAAGTVILMLSGEAAMDVVLDRGTDRFAEHVAGRTIVHMGTTSPGVATTRAPASRSGSARCGERFHTTSGRPDRARLSAIGCPMMPRPTNPTSTETSLARRHGAASLVGLNAVPVEPVEGWCAARVASVQLRCSERRTRAVWR
jgi:hypothetical protein